MKPLWIVCYQIKDYFAQLLHLKSKDYHFHAFIFYFALIHMIYFWVIKSIVVQFGAIWSNFIKPIYYILDFWSNPIQSQMILKGYQ